jgi:hypothetical protein
LHMIGWLHEWKVKTLYQRGNQNPYIEVEQTKQWPKEKVQKDKQWSTKHTDKTKDRVTRTPLKIIVRVFKIKMWQAVPSYFVNPL